MKTLIRVCFISVCLFAIIGYQSISIADDVDDRNCIAIIDSKDFKVPGDVLHRTIVEFALRSVHGNDVRVVIHGSTDTPEEFIDSILTTPCKVTNISMFSLKVANIIKTYNIKLREDSVYLLPVGNIKAKLVDQLEKYYYLNGKYYFDDNVILVAGSERSFSFSCGFISHVTLTKCVVPKFGPKSKFEAGIVEYNGNVYSGSNYASPVYAGTLLKMIMNEK